MPTSTGHAFLSSKNSSFQNEAKCKTLLVKMSFICMRTGGGALAYISDIGTCVTQSGRVFAQFWSENGYTLCLVWSGLRYGFRGT